MEYLICGWRPIHAQGSSLPRVHPSRRRMGAHPYRETSPVQDPSYKGPIPAQGHFMPKAHPARGPIDAQGPSLLMAHPSRRLMSAHLCQRLIDAQATSILSAHGGSSIPKADPCPGLIHPEGPLGTIHDQGLSIQRANDQFMPRAHPCQPIHPERPPIHNQGNSLPKAHPFLGPIEAHRCPGSINA